MKAFAKISIAVAMTFAFALPSAFSAPRIEANAASISATTKTGYDSADDVKYVTAENGKYIANWGAREEDCVFLSKYAQDFYTGGYAYDTMSKLKGGTSKSDAPKSALYYELQELMQKKHTHTTSYGETRYQYRYTDCVHSQYSNISSFYSGKEISGDWNGTWNREHTWPNSKGLGGQDENDIMMLRPTWTQENSSRGNTAYGKSSGYYNPNSESKGKHDLRGDCARITLYVYTRWGNTGKMWGPNTNSSGVIESPAVLLEWMEADPVDTWEMGRNDAVQKITGTRNVFVDYPEYAWLLLGEEIPKNMTTPSSGKSTSTNPPSDSSSSDSSSGSNIGGSEFDDPNKDSSTENNSSNSSDSSSEIIDDSSREESSSQVGDEVECEHAFGLWEVVEEPTEDKYGKKSRTCENCGKVETKRYNLGDVLNEESSSEGGVFGCQAAICSPLAGLTLLAGCALLLKKRRN